MAMVVASGGGREDESCGSGGCSVALSGQRWRNAHTAAFWGWGGGSWHSAGLAGRQRGFGGREG
jgi:hypothetical protein